MSWRAFQVGFLIGIIAAAWSLADGAMAIRTLSDVVAGGIAIGVITDGIWRMIRTNTP